MCNSQGYLPLQLQKKCSCFSLRTERSFSIACAFPRNIDLSQRKARAHNVPYGTGRLPGLHQGPARGAGAEAVRLIHVRFSRGY
eukprot:575280-Prorocentrum_minimum.AAC.1